jgi:hypothetical protein
MSFVDDKPRQEPLTLSVLALLLAATFGSSAASAQTVIVQAAAKGSTLEVTLNGATVATGTVNDFGDAALTMSGRTDEINALIFIDTCPEAIRVHLVSRGVQPVPSQPGCIRTDVGSVFVIRPITTLVVDIGPSPSVHIAQGPPPSAWLREGSIAPSRPTTLAGKPGRDLVLSGGVGFSRFSNSASKACGDASPCDGVNFGVATTLEAQYWIVRYVAAHVAYLRPADVTATGSGTNYHFNTTIQTRLVTLGAAGGAPIGPARLYGLGGFTHHEATLSTTETTNDTTVTIGNVTQTIKGGTQVYAQKTAGWEWFAGGGIEAWANRWIGFYFEINVAKVKGTPTTGGEGGIDDFATFALGGARLHVGR